ncbi:MAG: N-acetyltransferase [Acidobacteria bacterium]|nr:N-acetyltransferase [Acidobacteriota bacterium]
MKSGSGGNKETLRSIRNKAGTEHQYDVYAECGQDCRIDPSAIVGFRYKEDCGKARLGSCATIRALTIVYGDVTIGSYVNTGHHVLIREKTVTGDRIVIGSGTIIDGNVSIGNFVKIESRVYIPTHTTIGDYVFIGPGAVLTNDRYPLRRRAEYDPRGPILENNVTIGANATVLPGVRIGEGAMVGAGSVVTRDVPPWHLALGSPARTRELPVRLREPNRAKRW